MSEKTDEEKTASYVENQFTDEFTGGSFIPPNNQEPKHDNEISDVKTIIATTLDKGGYFVKQE
jgi:hypothetical protein